MGRLSNIFGRSTVFASLVAALMGAAALMAASAGAAPLVWISNTGEESLSTIESANGRITGTPITVGEAPTWIAITPDGSRALVVDHDESVSVVETATRKALKPIPLPGAGEGVAISPSGELAWVTDEGDEEVHVIDPARGTLGRLLRGRRRSRSPRLQPDRGLAYVGVCPKKSSRSTRRPTNRRANRSRSAAIRRRSSSPPTARPPT